MLYQRLLSRLLLIPSALLLALALGCGSYADGDEPLATTELGATTFAITSLGVEGGCTAGVRARFTPAPAISGKTLVRYDFYRRRKVGTSFTPWARVNSVAASATLAIDYHFLAKESYEYHLVPIYTTNGVEGKGTKTASVAHTPSCTQQRATSGTTHQLAVYLFTPKDVSPPATWTRQNVTNLMFAESNANSLFNFMQDVSAGLSHTPYVPQVRIGGTVNEWQKLSKNNSQYPKGWADMVEETRPLFNQLYAADPSKIYVFLFNAPQGGGVDGDTWIRSSISTLDRGIGIGSLAHELGHAFGLHHELAINCGSANTYPQRLEDIATSCSRSTYSSSTNVMSATDIPHYFNALQKWRLGFLKSDNVTWVDVRTLSTGTSQNFTLYNSTTAMNSAALQIIMLKFENDDTAYALQYRKAGGFDTTVTFGDGTAPFPAGVYVYLYTGRNLGFQDESTQTPLLAKDGLGFLYPMVVTGTTAATSFSDPHRKVKVTVSELNSSYARVTVTRL